MTTFLRPMDKFLRPVDMSRNDECILPNIVSAIAINGAAPKTGEKRLLFDPVIKIRIRYFITTKKIKSWENILKGF